MWAPPGGTPGKAARPTAMADMAQTPAQSPSEDDSALPAQNSSEAAAALPARSPFKDTAALPAQNPPEDMPAASLDEHTAPSLPEETEGTDRAYTCTFSIRCDTLLDNMDALDAEKRELVPEDGVVLPAVEATFYEGESVFDVLRRETKRAGIHMEYVDTPIYNSAYIEGIGNLYEFDCGERSGWMYKVNDWFPNYGSSRYVLADKDVVLWVYTCDLGTDVGGDYSAGQQD